ncbi:MAG: prepilin-type N-terminal cleavage/methylation domain-containing protein [Phycisphaerae bacterium]|jgi:prepilin-type N-terminal cleavage/methylation domain-containing protein
MRNTTSGRGRGFSLVEVAVATAIIGIAVTALMASLAAGTRSNRASQQLTQAVFLAQELREWTSTLPFKDPDPADANNPPGPDGTSPQSFVDDLDDLTGVTYSPPVDCTSAPAQRLNGLRGWSETFTLTWRDPNNLTHAVSNGGSEIINVQVDIKYQNRIVLTSGWIVAKKE